MNLRDMEFRRAAITTTVTLVLLVAVVIVAIMAYSLSPSLLRSTVSSTAPMTESTLGSRISSQTDTYLSQCAVTGVGALQLLVASDLTSAPVTGETINATDSLGCDISGQPAETQVIHVISFKMAQGGWLSPVFPIQATNGGELNITVSYSGVRYNFSASIPPIGVSCVILHVPSGNVTKSTTNNQCS